MIGNLVADPELRFTAAGKAVVNFRIAASSRKKQGDEWVDGDSCFLTVSAWDDTAENIAETLTKGQSVIVSGDLKQREYETNTGEKRTVYEIAARSVGPDLRKAVANKVKRNQSDARDPWGGGSNAIDEPPF